MIDFVEHWSPHFGPEALVLVFTVALLESSLKRHESRERLRRETLGGFLFVIRQCLQRDVYIDGGAAVILQDEWLALQQRAMERARLFAGEQLELFWECMKETEDLINTAANFAMIADALRRRKAEVRRLILDEHPVGHFWPMLVGLEDAAHAILREQPPETPWTPEPSNWLHERSKWLDEQFALLKAKQPNTVQTVLSDYQCKHIELLRERLTFWRRYVALKQSYLKLRDIVWSEAHPDDP